MRRERALARELPGWLSGALVLALGGALLALERRRPLRARARPKARADLRNLGLALTSAAAIRAVEAPLVTRLSRRVHAQRLGLAPRLGLPPALELLLAFLLLDYTLYLWHVLTHERPFLWRFHRVHHADLDLDATTALRFHFAEMLLSVPWRAAQVRLIGAAPLCLSVWQTATLLAILFHHANVELPEGLERRLQRLVMTPRMHGIHHSARERESSSNWSTILAWPDWLHGTALLDVPQERIELGQPDLRAERQLTLPRLLALPFARRARAYSAGASTR